MMILAAPSDEDVRRGDCDSGQTGTAGHPSDVLV